MPTEKCSLESTKFGYTTTPQPIPRFEGKENCTFTVRVPRFRIDANHREEICARRALWGTAVYTDDSDPVAAAIHSGFIRGAWNEEVDTDMLDLEIKDSHQQVPKDTTITNSDQEPSNDGTDISDSRKRTQSQAQTRVPPNPPADRDVHITLLILPNLEHYEQSILYGIKSRSWDDTHDGMSFKVLRVDWVDEGVGRGEERNGEARRKRLRNLMHSGRICTGPGMIRLDQLRVRPTGHTNHSHGSGNAASGDSQRKIGIATTTGSDGGDGGSGSMDRDHHRVGAHTQLQMVS